MQPDEFLDRSRLGISTKSDIPCVIVFYGTCGNWLEIQDPIRRSDLLEFSTKQGGDNRFANIGIGSIYLKYPEVPP